MKILYQLLFILLTSCANGKTVYTGSTPGNTAVKSFLGIPLSHSIDFIRWKLVIGGDHYSLHCEYGMGKPNTNGFIDPKTVDIKGKMEKEGNYYRLHHLANTILLAVFNNHVLHFANADKSFMTGTAGWSYTLVATGPALPMVIKPQGITLKDSLVFQGRTPCPEFSKLGISLPTQCYKLKWVMVLYASKGKPSTYSIRGTPGSRTGRWKIKNRMIILEAAHPLYLIIPDDNIILFTDGKWNLMQGNADFTYTLNRR